jgi:hypothetical protein
LITDEILTEFKNRMHLGDFEDDNLKELLSFSVTYVKTRCGDFDLEGDKDTDKQAKELVFERTRYLYNDALEYFEDNFLSEILNLSLSLGGYQDATE